MFCVYNTVSNDDSYILYVCCEVPDTLKTHILQHWRQITGTCSTVPPKVSLQQL
jgi:hypothetical protein